MQHVEHAFTSLNTPKHLVLPSPAIQCRNKDCEMTLRSHHTMTSRLDTHSTKGVFAMRARISQPMLAAAIEVISSGKTC